MTMKCRCASGSCPESYTWTTLGWISFAADERLPAEPRHEAVVLGQVLGQQLDRDLALQDVVARAVDGRHPAGSEPLVEPVPPRYLDAEHGHAQPPPSGTDGASALPGHSGAALLPRYARVRPV